MEESYKHSLYYLKRCTQCHLYKFKIVHTPKATVYIWERYMQTKRHTVNKIDGLQEVGVNKENDTMACG